jgi:hypothetical protein
VFSVRSVPRLSNEDQRLSLDSSVNIVTSSRAEQRPDRLWGLFNVLMNAGGCSVVKRPGRVADRLPTSNAEFKNAWSYTSIHKLVVIQIINNKFVLHW